MIPFYRSTRRKQAKLIVQQGGLGLHYNSSISLKEKTDGNQTKRFAAFG